MTKPFEIRGQAQFYKNLEPLSPSAHAKLFLKTGSSPFGFAHASHAAPVTVSEFTHAAVCYPIVFTPAPHQPLAVMGIQADANLFIGEDGAVTPGAYLPAFVRRYPFIFVEDEGQDRVVLCIDRDADAVSKKGDTPLFIDGKPSPATENAIAFCQSYEVEKRQTQRFVDLLVEFDLLETRQAVFNRPDQPEAEGELLATFFAVSEAKLDDLPEDKWQKLRDIGALPALYAHLISQMNWKRLAEISAAAEPAR